MPIYGPLKFALNGSVAVVMTVAIPVAAAYAGVSLLRYARDSIEEWYREPPKRVLLIESKVTDPRSFKSIRSALVIEVIDKKTNKPRYAPLGNNEYVYKTNGNSSIFKFNLFRDEKVFDEDYKPYYCGSITIPYKLNMDMCRVHQLSCDTPIKIVLNKNYGMKEHMQLLAPMKSKNQHLKVKMVKNDIEDVNSCEIYFKDKHIGWIDQKSTYELRHIYGIKDMDWVKELCVSKESSFAFFPKDDELKLCLVHTYDAYSKSKDFEWGLAWDIQKELNNKLND